MPYSINRYNSTTLTVVEDGTIDTTTDIKLIGKNYAGYGEVQNENFVFLLENFSGTTAPPKPVSGQLWFDSSIKKLKFYDALRWRSCGGAEVATSAPSGVTTGDFWWDSANDQLYSWNGSEFILIGPQGVQGFGTTAMRSRSIKDVSNVGHAIIEGVTNDDTVFIISSDSDFQLDGALHPDLAALGFAKIKKGVTMVNTGDSGVTTTDHKFWGTASNTIKFNGASDTEFVKSATAQFTAVARYVDAGLTIGGSNDLGIFVDTDGVTPVIKNTLGNSIKFQTTSAGTKTPLQLIDNDIVPGTNITSNIGSSSYRYATVYALTFDGTATQADSLNVGGSFRAASTSAGINTIAARDASGDIYANLFQGTATRARFADLAEKYTTDQEYEIGTVVMIGGEKEVTEAQVGYRAIGAISANPAYLMNSEAEGQAVALKGRVPVKVDGPIIKGQRLVAGSNGTAQPAFGNSTDVFAIALETNNDPGLRLVECLVL